MWWPRLTGTQKIADSRLHVPLLSEVCS
jgi:hypothetical protein